MSESFSVNWAQIMRRPELRYVAILSLHEVCGQRSTFSIGPEMGDAQE